MHTIDETLFFKIDSFEMTKKSNAQNSIYYFIEQANEIEFKSNQLSHQSSEFIGSKNSIAATLVFFPHFFPSKYNQFLVASSSHSCFSTVCYAYTHR